MATAVAKAIELETALDRLKAACLKLASLAGVAAPSFDGLPKDAEAAKAELLRRLAEFLETLSIGPIFLGPPIPSPEPPPTKKAR